MNRLEKTVRKVLRTVANYDPKYHDMYADPAESLFARTYTDHFLRHAKEAGLPADARVLEAGCQTGRLAIPLAQAGFRVTGIDRSGFALRRAQSHARRLGVRIEWVKGDFLEKVESSQAGFFDMVVCAEVVYQVKAYEWMIQKLSKALRPGGLLFISHRLRSYYIVESLRHDAWDMARRVAESSEGEFDQRFHQAGYFNWQTLDELKALYTRLGLEWLDWHPIDRLAWGCQGSVRRFSESQRRQWLALESSLPKAADTAARYALVAARQRVQ
jgi:2-polyprenyl-3-methyl-5-hydroxy-6-metoxy-1,4-benzoquinol methylase